jgi:hypothetical protein
MSRSVRNRQTLLLLFAALVVRAGIPDGYMPSAQGDGLLFELCPAGVPAGFIAALTGSDRHHHHNEPDDSRLHFDAGQCPIGHLLSSAVAFDNHWQSDVVPELRDFIVDPDLTITSRVPVSYRSRGPPA